MERAPPRSAHPGLQLAPTTAGRKWADQEEGEGGRGHAVPDTVVIAVVPLVHDPGHGVQRRAVQCPPAGLAQIGHRLVVAPRRTLVRRRTAG